MAVFAPKAGGPLTAFRRRDGGPAWMPPFFIIGPAKGSGRLPFRPYQPPPAVAESAGRAPNIIMVDFNLMNSLGNLDVDVDEAVATALPDAVTRDSDGKFEWDLSKLVKGDEVQDFTPGAIIKGKISSTIGDDFVVELGLKSEGVLEKGEFDDPTTVKVGDEVRVLLEDVEGDTGLVKISKRKADRIINWEAIMKSK